MGRALRLVVMDMLVGGGGGGAPLVYLADFVFKDYADSAGPLTSPLAGRSGNDLVLTQTDGKFGKSGQDLTTTAQTTPAWGDLGAICTAAGIAGRVAGMAYFLDVTPANAAKYTYFVLDGALAASINDGSLTHGVLLGNSVIAIKNRAVINFAVETLAASNYALVILLRAEGAFYYVRGGAFGNWQLLWVDLTVTANTGGVIFQPFDSAPTARALRVANLTAAGNDYSEAGLRDLDLSASVAAPVNSGSFAHTSDCIVTWTQTTKPAAGEVTDVYFRKVGSASVRVQLNGTGQDVRIIDTNGGNTVIDTGGTLADGALYEVILQGSSISVKQNHIEVAAGTLTKALSGTAGSFTITGGVMADFTARTLDGAANASSANFPGYGLATDVLPGVRAAADTFVHDASAAGMELKVLLTAIPTAGTTRIQFSRQDADNCYWIEVNSSGDLLLGETVASADATLQTAATALSGGERLTIRRLGTTIRGWYGTTLAWTHSTATRFTGETAGAISSVGTNSIVRNLITWPVIPALATQNQTGTRLAGALDRFGWKTSGYPDYGSY